MASEILARRSFDILPMCVLADDGWCPRWNTNKSYRSKIDKNYLFQQKKYYGIVIIYFKCGLFVKVVEK